MLSYSLAVLALCSSLIFLHPFHTVAFGQNKNRAPLKTYFGKIPQLELTKVPSREDVRISNIQTQRTDNRIYMNERAVDGNTKPMIDMIWFVEGNDHYTSHDGNAYTINKPGRLAVKEEIKMIMEGLKDTADLQIGVWQHNNRDFKDHTLFTDTDIEGLQTNSKDYYGTDFYNFKMLYDKDRGTQLLHFAYLFLTYGIPSNYNTYFNIDAPINPSDDKIHDFFRNGGG
ncbi:MAG: hypothetical protein OXC44_05640, partial [Proteobacteria bacterium]|nr:hypothetical protein [Pseudomonadota bacterium]